MVVQRHSQRATHSGAMQAPLCRLSKAFRGLSNALERLNSAASVFAKRLPDGFMSTKAPKLCMRMSADLFHFRHLQKAIATAQCRSPARILHAAKLIAAQVTLHSGVQQHSCKALSSFTGRAVYLTACAEQREDERCALTTRAAGEASLQTCAEDNEQLGVRTGSILC